MLLFATATVASAEPDKAPADVEVINPDTADSETQGAKVNRPGGDAELAARAVCHEQHSNRNFACFDPDGDWFSVYDGKADGASAAAFWWTDYGRSGICYNSNEAGTWADCNYNMREDGIVYWRTCYQNLSSGGDLYCTASVKSSRIGN
jgi:hypothetical protein